MDLPGSAIPVFPLLWKPGALWTTGRDSLPLCAPEPSRAVPLMGGALLLVSEVCPGAVTRKLPLFPFAGLNLIRFHGSRINGLSLASFDGQHSDKMAPVYTACLFTQP